MKRLNITNSLIRNMDKYKISTGIKSQEISEKIEEINKFMAVRKKWEKGLFSSKTVIK